MAHCDDIACDRQFIATSPRHRYCSSRCRSRAGSRRRYARPEVRDAARARMRAYNAEVRRVKRLKDAAYRAANRDLLAAKQRERDRLRREPPVSLHSSQGACDEVAA